jgi:hypothetical protein
MPPQPPLLISLFQLLPPGPVVFVLLLERLSTSFRLDVSENDMKSAVSALNDSDCRLPNSELEPRDPRLLPAPAEEEVEKVIPPRDFLWAATEAPADGTAAAPPDFDELFKKENFLFSVPADTNADADADADAGARVGTTDVKLVMCACWVPRLAEPF